MFLALAFALIGCRAASPTPRDDAERLVIESTLNELYRAFCFDAGGEADWDAMRALFVEGAVFVAPFACDQTPTGVGADEFLADFRRYTASDAVRSTGLHERILNARVDVFGGVAHAFVAFEGFVPGTGEFRSRGLDSIQLLRDRGRWRVVSFTTQYASDASPLPARFLVGG